MDTFAEHAAAARDVLMSNPYVQALGIALGALVAAKAAEWFLVRLIGRWSRRTRSPLDDRIVAMVHRPVFVTVLLLGLAAATERIALPPRLGWFTTAALKTIGIAVWLGFAVRLARLALEHISERRRSDVIQPSTVPIFDSAAKIVILGGGVYFLLLAWNVDVSAWLASAGIIGLALSFAAKDSLANLFAGLFILADRPYKVGDYIILDSGDRGKVTMMGMRSTRLLTRDDVEITIPNSIMGNSKIINESGGPYVKSRLRLAVGVAYGSDVDRVRQVLMRVAREHGELCEEPEPQVRFVAFGDSSLDFELRVWIPHPEERGRLQDELNTRIYKVFAEEGIRIPFPQRDVHLYTKGAPAG